MGIKPYLGNLFSHIKAAANKPYLILLSCFLSSLVLIQAIICLPSSCSTHYSIDSTLAAVLMQLLQIEGRVCIIHMNP